MTPACWCNPAAPLAAASSPWPGSKSLDGGARVARALAPFVLSIPFASTQPRASPSLHSRSRAPGAGAAASGGRPGRAVHPAAQAARRRQAQAAGRGAAPGPAHPRRQLRVPHPDAGTTTTPVCARVLAARVWLTTTEQCGRRIRTEWPATCRVRRHRRARRSPRVASAPAT